MNINFKWGSTEVAHSILNIVIRTIVQILHDRQALLSDGVKSLILLICLAAHPTKYGGGTCSVCANSHGTIHQSTFAGRAMIFATGRVNDNDQAGHEEANRMCKRYTSEVMWTQKGELESLKDLRVLADMFPETPTNIYRACLAGIRRQKY